RGAASVVAPGLGLLVDIAFESCGCARGAAERRRATLPRRAAGRDTRSDRPAVVVNGWSVANAGLESDARASPRLCCARARRSPAAPSDVAASSSLAAAARCYRCAAVGLRRGQVAQVGATAVVDLDGFARVRLGRDVCGTGLSAAIPFAYQLASAA